MCGLEQLTGNDPSRMAESAAINKSLSVLGQVVHALNQGAVCVHNYPCEAPLLLIILIYSLVSHTVILN
jgi:hypothetical protein